MAGPREETKKEINDFLYELSDTGSPHLEIGDKLAGVLGTEGEDLFDADAPLTKKEEENEILKKVTEEYDIPGMKDTIDETGQVSESIYFFYGGDSQNFVDALKFIGLSPINREFAAFLLSDLGRETMTQNKLSIHAESGDIFYDNHNTEENFYSFYCLNKTMKLPTYLKSFLTAILLKNISLVFCKCSPLTTKKNLIF